MDKGIDWTCTACREHGNDIKGLKSLILQLQKEVQDLRFNNNRCDPVQFEEIVEEVNQRNRRKRNLIIFKIEDQNQQEQNQVKINHEKTSTTNLIRVLDPDVVIPDLKPVRLGPFTQGKNRPIKVVLGSEHDVHRLIRNSKILKTHKNYKNISISFNRTPRQIEYYLNLKIELENRKKSSETNLHIKYVKGIPQIVILN
nr:unnamed protein product [Callosobruchus analis]